MSEYAGVAEGDIYFSKSGLMFIVDSLARHGQDCSHTMVVYRNIDPTEDSEPGITWVLSEYMFLKRFHAK